MRRVRQLAAALTHDTSAPPGGADDSCLLSDEEMRQFIGGGFLVRTIPDLPVDFHGALYEKALREYGPNNNGLRGTGGTVERIPELKTVIHARSVVGALTSLLGPDYTNGHLGDNGCAMHVATDEDQIFHKDTQRAVITGHRTRAVMVMYYPGGAE
jgi:hypothetical protein